MVSRAGLRALLRWLHRWLGLTLGLLFVVVALSGSLLLFQAQYFEWAHGELIPDDLADAPGSVEAWVANARAAVPGRGDPVAIWRPHVAHNVSDAGMLIFAGGEPGGLGNMGLTAVLVAPATAEVLGVVDVDRSPGWAPLFLHRDLWAGETGRIVSGVMAVGALVMFLIGLYLWWPSWQHIGRKLSPRPWRSLANAMRLHDWLGVSTLVLLSILTATGLYLVRPAWIEPALALLPDPEHDPAAGKSCGAPIGFDAAIAAARGLAPGRDWTAIYPDDHPGRWAIGFKADGDTDRTHGDVWVYADLSCGIVAPYQTRATRSPRDTVKRWLEGLHDGSIFGTPGEVLVALLGLIPAVLYVTGFIVWRRKRKARRREAAPRAGATSAAAG